MSDTWTIRAHALSKIYRLYRRPAYRLLDLFGLCPAGEHYYTEHRAVDRLDLMISRGEKVAIIGRNGAGKSTLLKLISGVLRPTSGAVEVRGSIKALLEMGTGFHPEFTGRENVLSALAYQGIVGPEARRKLEEVVDFAELEEYIDQPMRAYSAGMKMRLMFSAATCVEPAILVVDEVLSVGDAYFTHKSLERTRRLVEAQGTTLLLVTHDPMTALSICERFIWIDRGRIALDGSAQAAMAAYEHSIKEQEERRQRRRKIRVAEVDMGTPSTRGLIVRIRPEGAPRIEAPFHLASLVAAWASGRRVPCSWGSKASGASFRVLPSPAVVEQVHDGRECATLREYGDIFHQMNCWLMLPDTEELPEALEVEYMLESAIEMTVETSIDGLTFEPVAVLSGQAGEWMRRCVDLQRVPEPGEGPVAQPAPAMRDGSRYGSGEITIEAIRLMDEFGEASRSFPQGGVMRIEVDYVVRDQAVQGLILASAGIHKAGYLPVTVFVSPAFQAGPRSGTVVLAIENLRLTRGQYMLAFGIFRPEVMTRGMFYTMSPDVHDHLPCAALFEVVAEDQPQMGWVYIQEGKWSVPA